MALKNYSDSNFTQQVKSIISRLYQRSAVGDTLLDGAIRFFSPESNSCGSQVTKKENHLIEQELKSIAEDGIVVQSSRANQQKANEQIHNRTYADLLNICSEILSLSEGEDFDEDNIKTAKFLGTVQLLSNTESNNNYLFNEKVKPLYKALMSLRLFDRLYTDGLIEHAYIDNIIAPDDRYKYADIRQNDELTYLRVVNEIKLPFLIAALVQDIGTFHPNARAMLTDDDGLEDITKILTIEERKKFIQISFKATNDFLIEGLGMPTFNGNTREEKDTFVETEQRKQQFIRSVLRSAIKPKENIGSLLKVCQIYTSFVVSTKANNNYKLLPKVFQMLYKNAEHGHCAKPVVDALHVIMGDYPQGYGITYIPDDSTAVSEFYEYAIVNRLYPEKPNEPHCRTATRALQFVGYGQDIIVCENSNLWFPHVARSFTKISTKRLHEILELLASNYEERKILDLIPRCWHPESYFSLREFQNLWTKREVLIRNMVKEKEKEKEKEKPSENSESLG